MCQSRLGITTPLLLSLTPEQTRAHSDKYTVCALMKLQHWQDKFAHETEHSRTEMYRLKSSLRKNTQTSASPVHTCTQKLSFCTTTHSQSRKSSTQPICSAQWVISGAYACLCTCMWARTWTCCFCLSVCGLKPQCPCNVIALQLPVPQRCVA